MYEKWATDGCALDACFPCFSDSNIKRWMFYLEHKRDIRALSRPVSRPATRIRVKAEFNENHYSTYKSFRTIAIRTNRWHRVWHRRHWQIFSHWKGFSRVLHLNLLNLLNSLNLDCTILGHKRDLSSTFFAEKWNRGRMSNDMIIDPWHLRTCPAPLSRKTTPDSS